MVVEKKKATFNLREETHQGLKLAGAVQKREMVDLVEEALGAYFKWSTMTGTELNELEIYKTAEYDGAGKATVVGFFDLCKQLTDGPANQPAVEQLLIHLQKSGLLVLEVNDGQTGFKPLMSFPDGAARLYGTQPLRLSLTVPGRIRYQQLQARTEWEQQSGKVLFEFGETKESEAFFTRNPNFYSAFERLAALVNKCFVRPLPRPHYGPDYIRFSLGESCRADFLEILFLAVNGYGGGASKLLRGLYERSVALAYMVKEPPKTERFANFAAIQQHKLLNDALKVTTEKEWDDIMGAGRTAAETKAWFEEVKQEFQRTACQKCKTKRTAISWDLDVASMVARVGAPYDMYYLLAYSNANLVLHATLASALRDDNKDIEARRAKQRAEADSVLFCSAMLLIEVIRSENTLFQLALDDEIQASEDAMAKVWKESMDARNALRARAGADAQPHAGKPESSR